MGEEDIQQKLMDEAYEIWQKEENEKWSFEDFIINVRDTLGDLHYFAVISGKMNQQVENGGWFQWHDNEYSCCIEDLIDFFHKFNQPEFKTLLNILSNIGCAENSALGIIDVIFINYC